MHLQSDICIIGNGAIGKTAALGFAQAGLSVTLLSPVAAADVQQEGSWDVRVYALNHVASELLGRLRVWDALDTSRIAPVDAMRVHGDGDGDQHIGKLGFDAYGARVNALAWIIEDSNLNRALDAALKFTPKIQCVAGRAVGMDTGGAHALVHLENGDSIEAQLLVGADGAQSWVRNQADIGIAYRSYGQRAIVANFDCALAHHGVAHQWFDPLQGVVALLPLPGNRVSLVWSAPEALADVIMRESMVQLAERLAAFAAPMLGALTPIQPEVRKALPLNFIRPQAITAPRVALIGDAAHVVHPLAGHGMNLGFADVDALIKTVLAREAHRDCGDARVLGRFARARKEEILLMQLATDGLERLFSSDFEPVRVVRNLGMNLLDSLPVLKRHLISQALGRFDKI